jgi:hypothetical protein
MLVLPLNYFVGSSCFNTVICIYFRILAIEFYVKFSSAVAAILVGGLKCRTQFWKGTTEGSFQQSLVEIGSVVSEKILFIFHPPQSELKF